MSDDSLPAFPGAIWETPESEYPSYTPGMSLRDWFAGMAITGLIAAADDWPEASWCDSAAKRAYLLADAMLEQRKK